MQTKDHKAPSTMESLPREIAANTLSRLPITSLVNVKFVCRSWRILAQDPLLGHMRFSRTTENNPCLNLRSPQHELYAVDFSANCENIEIVKKIRVPTLPMFHVASTCNGLLWLCDSLPGNGLYIYNPFTMDCMELPKSAEYPNQQVVIGFGFCQTANVYKVVKVVHYSNKGMIRPFGSNFPQSEVQIFDFGSLIWRSLGEVPYQLFQRPSQALINGRLRWVTWPLRYSSRRLIVSFDVSDEKFWEVPKPDCGSLDNFNYHLTVLGGCLSAAVYRNHGKLEIWVMKEYDAKESWIMKYNIDVEEQFLKNSKLLLKSSNPKVLCLLKKGEILLEYRGRALVSFDPNLRTLRELSFHDLPKWFETTVHVGSLNWFGSVIDA